MIAQALSVLLLESFLDEGNVSPGIDGFLHVRVEFEHPLKVL
jgi:hypothetical protein